LHAQGTQAGHPVFSARPGNRRISSDDGVSKAY
jgi:hypothetical protein